MPRATRGKKVSYSEDPLAEVLGDELAPEQHVHYDDPDDNDFDQQGAPEEEDEEMDDAASTEDDGEDGFDEDDASEDDRPKKGKGKAKATPAQAPAPRHTPMASPKPIRAAIKRKETPSSAKVTYDNRAARSRQKSFALPDRVVTINGYRPLQNERMEELYKWWITYSIRVCRELCADGDKLWPKVAWPEELPFAQETAMLSTAEVEIEGSGQLPWTQSSLPLWHGPFQDQKLTELSPFQSLSVEEDFPGKTGYITNAAHSIQSLAWLPNRAGNEDQILAVSGHPDVHYEPTSVFEILQGKQVGHIQFFRIPVSEDQVPREPKLASVVLHKYGAVWNLIFCPYGCKSGSRAGLLGMLTADAKVRVFATEEEWLKKEEGETVYIDLRKAAWEFEIESGVSAFSWVSHEEIAVAGNNGSVATFSLTDSGPSHNLPLQLFPLMSCAVRAMTSCGPSFPHFLQVYGYDCSLKLVDLRDPVVETGTAPRARKMCYASVWHEYTQGVLSADDGNAVDWKSVRAFLNHQQVTQHLGSVTSIATSLSHPLILITCTDGICDIVNVMKKTLSGHTVPQFRRHLFQLDYDIHTKEFRMTDGWKAEQINLTTSTRKKKGAAGEEMNVGTAPAFLKEVNVGKAVWCPSVGCAGWVAVGMSCGLLRIEDMSRGVEGAPEEIEMLASAPIF
ncbi:hypothetical protein SAICODRAFT_10174 [Saitoella complicata NRRL Y-17804]|uniref:Uncharacterized protein n=1 Tax=Saitoella complicata (strain BCRC 22490 / CBS 7301 / JCM 7358 / NBRC 10748 / NRRL Y-17804) TaxID=698492 RepID=A0A0E9NJ60_SAICN|nr:uncharacterized protein SAICODRAFT_10174 [Saitoella complicata NRRL Y-17804]ODQ50118.1 hypothetical protein SAICODRAFT_10174 [Saitoella complicata NRRL Y-17804]GAO49897.1 hypothetical protein G7K_4034-t1 [Saitoella complicata NRRL Y-17804]